MYLIEFIEFFFLYRFLFNYSAFLSKNAPPLHSKISFQLLDSFLYDTELLLH